MTLAVAARAALVAALALAGAPPLYAQAAAASSPIQLQHTKFTLPNGQIGRAHV